MEANPLAGITQDKIELFLAQALTELTGHSARVTLRSAEHSPPYVDSGHSVLQLGVTFSPPSPEDEGELQH